MSESHDLVVTDEAPQEETWRPWHGKENPLEALHDWVVAEFDKLKGKDGKKEPTDGNPPPADIGPYPDLAPPIAHVTEAPEPVSKPEPEFDAPPPAKADPTPEVLSQHTLTQDPVPHEDTVSPAV